MRAIVEAIVASANLAALVRDETVDKELRRCAVKVLAKLHAEIDRLIAVKEETK